MWESSRPSWVSRKPWGGGVAEAHGWALYQGIRAHPVPQDIQTQGLIVMAQLEAGCLNFTPANSWTHEIQGSKVPWPLAEVGW